MKKLAITSLVLSIIAVLTVSTLIIFVVCSNKNVDMSLGEGVIGIIVALLALIVTIILGWQIYTAIDIKEKIVIIDELQNKQSSQEHRMEQMYYSSCRVIGCAMSAFDIGNESVHSFRWLLSALAASLKLDKPIDVEKLLSDIRKQVKAIKSDTTLEEKYINEINEFNRSIRESAHYTCFASTYDAIYLEFKQKMKTEQK
ncbi:MAG: hypothetical protein II825_01045 [Paludibacteraceae bacterium]|nr:hypothetical protein [Paludibacteraceae bacterium]